MIYVPPPGIPEEIAAAMKRGAGFDGWKESEVKRPAEKVKCATPLTLSTPSRTAPNLEANQKGTGKDGKDPKPKVKSFGALSFSRQAYRQRYQQWLSRPGRLPGHVPAALNKLNTNRAQRFKIILREMERGWGKLAALTLCPTEQPSDLRAAEEMLKAETQRLSSGKWPVLAVMQFDMSSLFHLHVSMPLAALGNGCLCGAGQPWRGTSWTLHTEGSEEALGHFCPACNCTWRPVKEAARWGSYQGSPVFSEVWRDRERAAGCWMLAVDELGRWPRTSSHVRMTPPSQALPSPFAALNLLTWLAAMIAQTAQDGPRKASGREAAPRVPSLTSSTPERAFISAFPNAPPGT